MTGGCYSSAKNDIGLDGVTEVEFFFPNHACLIVRCCVAFLLLGGDLDKRSRQRRVRRKKWGKREWRIWVAEGWRVVTVQRSEITVVRVRGGIVE